MFKTNIVSLDLTSRYLEEIVGFDFDKLKLDIEVLAQQPPVGVYPCYIGEEIDYEKAYRIINVKSEISSIIRFSYIVMDSANVKGSINNTEFVGRKIYTQQEVEELRNQEG